MHNWLLGFRNLLEAFHFGPHEVRNQEKSRPAGYNRVNAALKDDLLGWLPKIVREVYRVYLAARPHRVKLLLVSICR